jgi:hypothetical protein
LLGNPEIRTAASLQSIVTLVATSMNMTESELASKSSRNKLSRPASAQGDTTARGLVKAALPLSVHLPEETSAIRSGYEYRYNDNTQIKSRL